MKKWSQRFPFLFFYFIYLFLEFSRIGTQNRLQAGPDYKIIFYLFIYFWLCWVFVSARGLSLVAASGGYSSLRCVGFSLWWLLLLQSGGSRHVGFSGCGTWAQ